MNLQKVGLLFHPHRALDEAFERSLAPAARFLAEKAELSVEERLRDFPDPCARIEALGARIVTREEIFLDSDLVISFGGDGSLIAASSEVRDEQTFLLGINAGNLGFLTEGTLEEARAILEAVFHEETWVDSRMRLRAEVLRQGEVIVSRDALNDIVLRQGRTNSLLDIDASIDGVELIRYRADGVVAATPSGSTAYALSTGGPILHPSLRCIELSPIAAFTISARSIVIPSTGEIELSLVSPHHDATVCFDGQHVVDLKTEDHVRIRESPRDALFLRVHRNDYYRTLREKLGWHRDRA